MYGKFKIFGNDSYKSDIQRKLRELTLRYCLLHYSRCTLPTRLLVKISNIKMQEYLYSYSIYY
jgi:hypothetical protein